MSILQLIQVPLSLFIVALTVQAMRLSRVILRAQEEIGTRLSDNREIFGNLLARVERLEGQVVTIENPDTLEMILAELKGTVVGEEEGI